MKTQRRRNLQVGAPCLVFIGIMISLFESILDKNGKVGEMRRITDIPGFAMSNQITTGAMSIDVMQAPVDKTLAPDQATTSAANKH